MRVSRPGYREHARLAATSVLVAALALGRAALADDVLHVGTVSLDRPTLVALGIQLLVSGDDDFDAEVTVRYRPHGTATWSPGPPLLRVHPESVVGRTVPAQFAGSIFDLAPATTYDIELHASDPDGTDTVLTETGTTRKVPADPETPRGKDVGTAAALEAALGAAAPGDVITLANGTYSGLFRIDASGTADQPIVIRGASEQGVILDGGGCTGCNVLEIYGSFVHVEKLTLAHASRALRFQGMGAEGNVVRRVHTQDTVLGFGSNTDQKDFYICDNDLEGRLKWPAVYSDDGGAHANDDGIHVEGNGHVICHNRLVGFGDAMKTEQDGARAVDFYGNEVLSAYDNGVELDASEGNVRCFRNRFTNTYATISFQPIFGGPAYAFRNVVVNVANEQMKFHALGGTPPEEPSGILVYHNTFVSPGTALANHTSDTSHHFVLENNLFVTASTPDGRTFDWTSPIDDGTFDYDGYYPDGIFDFTFAGSAYQKVQSLAMAMAAHAGFETHGVLLATPIFESGLTAPAQYQDTLAPPDVTLAATSNAIDRGVALPGFNDAFRGAGPDLGALERGCATPIYGVRPEGTDETNEKIGCSSETGGADAGTDGGGAASGAGGAPSSAAGAGGSAMAGRTGAGGAGGTASPEEGGSTTTPSAGAQDSGPTGASTTRATDSSGCGCIVGRGPGAPNLTTLVALTVLLAGRRRRVRPG